jgi:hypothetical protein
MGCHSELKPLIMGVLSACAEATASEIAEKIGKNPRYVRMVLPEICAFGFGQLAHIVRFDGHPVAAVYVIGPGENAERTYKQSAEVRAARRAALKNPVYRPKKKTQGELFNHSRGRVMSEREIDNMHRCSDAWWPKADEVVVAAMTSMVRSARIAA